jgi:uncharacterized membrane protein HdeD (DUF308 family)
MQLHMNVSVISDLTLVIGGNFGLVLLFGVYAIVDGIFAFSSAVARTSRYGRGWAFLESFVGIAAGVLAFGWTSLTAYALILVIAAWAILTGSLKVAVAIRWHRELRGEGLLAVSGAASLLFGTLLLVWPITTALAAIWVLGFYGLIIGGLLAGTALRVYRVAQSELEPRDRAA